MRFNQETDTGRLCQQTASLQSSARRTTRRTETLSEYLLPGPLTCVRNDHPAEARRRAAVASHRKRLWKLIGARINGTELGLREGVTVVPPRKWQDPQDGRSRRPCSMLFNCVRLSFSDSVGRKMLSIKLGSLARRVKQHGRVRVVDAAELCVRRHSFQSRWRQMTRMRLRPSPVVTSPS